MLLLLLHGCMQLHSPFPSAGTADISGNPKALAVAGDCSLAAAQGSWFPCRPWAVLAALPAGAGCPRGKGGWESQETPTSVAKRQGLSSHQAGRLS